RSKLGMMMRRHGRFVTLLAALLVFCAAAGAQVEEAGEGPSIADFVEQATAPDEIGTTLTLFLLLTVLSLAPAIVVMTTSFLRIIVVLGFLRQAMATQQTPPNQVLIGLALFLTFFI